MSGQRVGPRADLIRLPQTFAEWVLRNRRATLGPRYAAAILSHDDHLYPGLPASYRGFTDVIRPAVVVASAPPIPDYHSGLPPSMQDYG